MQAIANALKNVLQNLCDDLQDEQNTNDRTPLLKVLAEFAAKLREIAPADDAAQAVATMLACRRVVSRLNTDVDLRAQLFQIESGGQYLADLTYGFNQLAKIVDPEAKPITLNPPKIRLKHLTAHNFTVFSDVTFDFNAGINVFIGENGTGKTHLLKLAFALCRTLQATPEDVSATPTERITRLLSGVFRCDRVGDLANFAHDKADVNGVFNPLLQTTRDAIRFKFSSISQQVVAHDSAIPPMGQDMQTVFIPTKEMVSLHKGFLSWWRTRESAFDETYRFFAEALDQVPLKLPPLLYQALKSVLSAALSGELKATERGFVVRRGNRELLAGLEAEGIRKILTLLYLAQNGEIADNAIVFWDEPEANTNPKLLKVLAAMLHVMAQHGVQLFIATHSLYLLKELNLLKQAMPDIPLTFFNLYFADRRIAVSSGDSLEALQHITALDASVEQFERRNQVFF